MTDDERLVRIEGIRNPRYRQSAGPLQPLVDSIRAEGLAHPVTLWRDATIISGSRRLHAHFLMGKMEIQAVFVDTIEDAAKRLKLDDDGHPTALPMKWSEACALWQVLRKFDAPNALQRLSENRRRGIELRRQTQSGQRPPGRANGRGDDYALGVICEPWGISSHTARKLEIVWLAAHGPDEPKRKLAQRCLDDIDKGTPITTAYRWLLAGSQARVVTAVAPPPATGTARSQLAAWNRSLPQMEGLMSGLIEMGAPHKDLTWEQVGPVHARLSAVRREMEKMIKQMKGLSK